MGFSSVYDCRNPIANLYIGEGREFKIWGNRITLAAIKGQSVSLFVHPEATAELEADWPENLEECLFEEYLSDREGRSTRKSAGRLRRLIKQFLRR